MPDDILINDLRKCVTERRVMVVVGAGVSVAATQNAPCASWMGLLRDGAERAAAVGRPPVDRDWKRRVLAEIDAGARDMDELLSAAEKISSKLGGPKYGAGLNSDVGGEYRRWLRETVGSLRATDSAILDALVALKCPLATTNYDQLLEDATGMPPVTWLDRHDVTRLLQGDEPGILHLHGYWKRPESVVLGLRSYDRVTADELAPTVLRALKTTKTILFVGFGAGIGDPNFAALFDWSRRALSGDEHRHYRLARANEVATLQSQHTPGDGVHVLPYGTDFEDLPTFLRSLTTTPSGHGSLAPIVRPRAPTPYPAGTGTSGSSAVTPAERRFKRPGRSLTRYGLALVTSLVVVGAMFGVRKYQVEQHLTKAVAAFAADHFLQTIASCEAALAIEPKSRQARNLHVQALFERSDCDAVIVSAAQALAIDPKNSNTYAYRSVCQYLQGNRAGAEHDAAQALALGPNSPMTHVAQASVFIEKYDHANAVASARRAVQLDGNSADAHLMLGDALAHGSNPDLVQARAECDTAIRLRPRLSAAFGCRAFAYNKAGEHAKALADAQEAIRLSPYGERAQQAHVWANLHLGNVDAAIRAASAYVGFTPNSPFTMALYGHALMKAGDVTPGLASLDRALEIDPDAADIYAARAYARIVAGWFQLAIDDANKAVELNARLASAFAYRGLAEYKVGRFEEASCDLTTAMNMESRNPRVYNWGLVADLRLSAWAAAISVLSQTMKVWPHESTQYVQLSEVLLLAGDLDGAFNALAEARRLDPTIPDEAPGLRVHSLVSGGPAWRRGLKVGDVLLAYDGQWLEDIGRLGSLDAADAPPERRLRVLRHNKIQEIHVKRGDLEGVACSGGSSIKLDLAR